MNPTIHRATLLRTTSVDAPRRLDYWRDMISSTFVALDCDAPASRDFYGSLETSALKDVQFSRVVSGAQQVVRTRKRISQSPDDFFLVSVQRDGIGFVAQGDRVAKLCVGDFALYDASKPYELNFSHPFEQLVLRFPREYLSRRITCPERLTAVAFQASQASTSIASNFILQLYQQLDRLESGSLAMMHQTLVDLLVAALSGTPPKGLSLPHRLVIKQRIKSFVEARLSDSSLSCTEIAAAHGISERYLHKLFEDDEMTLSEWMWTRRLDKARVALECSKATCQSITQIAYGFGFKDPAHFARAFRARFGATPSSFRVVPK